ncbi:GPI mannosyltransferase [Metarhizium album ARSEF 1941]|uniref:Mannosyltransferase n=1 Tax=Metarhizium album (strain ARSEF 1941) TaxID=1081103 RepID=A0A0B2WX20_METAS|nr:GPI mannosyltransferase [Metarhizium album ARSEF 1941]KHO00742.1 GPI mannosyltransferase [Metarhizium album ARSEF 1941]
MALSTTARLRRNERNRRSFLRHVISIRLINAWWIATFFQPDEYFQSLEPAWRLAFGPNSGAWLTWVSHPPPPHGVMQEWQHQLRSSLHPAMFSGAYLVADWASRLIPEGNMLRSAIVIASPKALQAVIAGLGDWYTWQLAVTIFGPDSNASFFALFLQLFSAWQWYCSTRTFSNSLETTLTVMALYYWPWPLFAAPPSSTKENPKPANILGSICRLRLSLSLAALAVVLRPTNLLIWATISAMALTRVSLEGPSPLTKSVILLLAREAFLCGSLMLAISVVSDYLYFGFWTFPPYNWLNFNISKSLAVFYGRNPWHYYLSQGIPLLCTTSLPFVLAGLYKPATLSTNASNALRVLSSAVFATVAALSLISHKEVRFIYPLLPILNIVAAPVAAAFFTSPPSSKAVASRPRLRNKPYLMAAVGVNLVLAGYLSFLHQPAPLSVLSYLRKEYERIHPESVQLAHRTHQPPAPRDELFALFLMPCHSTPWRSHLYYPGLDAYALTCEPPLDTQPNTRARNDYRDEADRFYDDPVGFLTDELFGPRRKIGTPRYIVGFEGIEAWLFQFLETPAGKALGIKPRRVWDGFNGFFNEDWRRSGRMLVWDTGAFDRPGPSKKRQP